MSSGAPATGRRPARASRPAQDRILDAASALLASSGRDAVSARAVSAAADVQPPTIYRHYGDMQGLLDAVANHGFATYVEAKTSRSTADDPVEDLRHGWDLHVEFGLTNPALYALMYGEPRPGHQLAAAGTAAAILDALVQRAAEHGRLRMDAAAAAAMFGAAGIGVVLTLLSQDEKHRDPDLSVTTREALITAITGDSAVSAKATKVVRKRPSQSDPATHASALAAALEEKPAGFTPGEHTLLLELLARVATTCSKPT